MARKETGKDGVLIVDGQEFRFTDLNFDDDVEVSTSENNQSMFPDKTPVGIDVSGDFEFDGSSAALRDATRKGNGEPKEGLRIQVQGDEVSYRIEGVIVSSIGRSYPGDERSSTSVDFEGERIV